jgi:hypothetical protein
VAAGDAGCTHPNVRGHGRDLSCQRALILFKTKQNKTGVMPIFFSGYGIILSRGPDSTFTLGPHRGRRNSWQVPPEGAGMDRVASDGQQSIP